MSELNFIKIEGLDAQCASEIVGGEDRNLIVLKEFFDKEISFRNDEFIVYDADEKTFELIKEVILALYEVVSKGQSISERDVIYACRLVSSNQKIEIENLYHKSIGKNISGKTIAPKTKGQLAFVEAMDKYDIVFAIGPAGTGKTYLAVVKAVVALKKGDVKRIVLTRPAVEAGESLGFLPGDLKEKVDPYLTPLYDALHDMLGTEQTDRLLEKGVIEIAPLAYMRGRTLEDAFIILDEAQNTTNSQMKMFLTRLGFNSKMVITGDITQIDLVKGQTSGLLEASRILQDVKEISVIELKADDVVRHPLVQKIIEKYGQYGKTGVKK